MKETCSCGAKFEYDRRGASLPDDRLQKVHAMMLDWRENHRHEMPEEPDQPTVIESGSSHERANDMWMPEESRSQIGFRAND